MASPRGRAWVLGLTLLPVTALSGLGLRPAAAQERTLLEETFGGKEPGSRPGPWVYFADEGNEAVVAEAPDLPGSCLRLTRSGGTVWKPMVSGWASGEADSPLQLELDWYLPALSEGEDPVLFVTIRGDGNIGTVTVALGGPGGVAVPQGGGEWAPLGFPLRAGVWGRLVVKTDPISRRAEGAFDVTVSQGDERAEYPNIPFRPNWQGDHAAELWHSPTFQVGGGSPERPREAHLRNVKLSTASPREFR
ncbi:MAG: hypothetical protein FJX74_21700 [Armatimonadetes bacterium]|nr:hypothetical protein [Armatimonadota bacterium]